ncbi:hypothetical protein DSL72_007103 [Monilinia vaccinii-corymbosi]|uniref:Uncharacterized protein n=1 Tax=Monilinia vaccinii-corymbosi TaxID=61207 RepID=A0A8A3PM44_9HELO|nr:hypothetical protein DSL72_007103 [Monilinia vaccinii-corymbosi]
MSTSPTPKATLRPSKFIEGPPLTSTAPNLAQSDEHLQIILLEMDSYEYSRNSRNPRNSHRKSKSRTPSSISSNSNSSHPSLPLIPFFTSTALKRMSYDFPALTSASNKRFSGVRASLDMSNPFTTASSSYNTRGRSRGSTIGSMINTPGFLDEISLRDAQILGLKIKGRLRAWSRGKDGVVQPYAGT